MASEDSNLSEVIAWLTKTGTKKQIAELGRYGIVAFEPYGIAMGELKAYAKRCGRDHDLALALWATRRYEARLLAVLMDEPSRVTQKQMESWAREFDNWALVDTACFSLFDRAPGAWKMVPLWSRARGEFKRRAAFALIWALSLHDKEADDEAFLACLPLIEKAATDDRNFVKKGVDMALRALGRRSARLNKAALSLAKTLAESDDASAAWIGRKAGRELAR